MLRFTIARGLGAPSALLLAALSCDGCGVSGTVDAACLSTRTCVLDTVPSGGVFVSSSLGQDDYPGTREKPVKTIAKAISIAAIHEGVVFACAETFVEAIKVPSAIEISGGFDCNQGWVYVGDVTKTTLTARPGAVVVTFLGGKGYSTLADVSVTAADASWPSGSSIAVLARYGSTVMLQHSEFIAGKGAPGADGTPGDPKGLPATAGNPGNAGLNACSADQALGGAQVTTICDGLESTGGRGGVGEAVFGTGGDEGTPATEPNPQGLGFGGTGQGGGDECISGAHGARGSDGENGHGGHSTGVLSESGYTGNSGGDGRSGLPGQGGGGGGGSRAGAQFCSAGSVGGASGGSGGSGGCGGRGGKGGGYGGASIAIASLNATVTITDSFVTAGQAGDGGLGGAAQIGGQGGLAGERGLGKHGSPSGCSGGDGGNGGNSGNGGGGLGGPSIGVAYFGLQPTATRTAFNVGQAGKGGLGGDPNLFGGPGEDGTAGAWGALLQ